MYALTYRRLLLPLFGKQKTPPANLQQSAPVQSLLGRRRLQARLKDGRTGDSYEQEAERIAGQVTHSSESNESLQARAAAESEQQVCAGCGSERPSPFDFPVASRSVAAGRSIEGEIEEFGAGEPLSSSARSYFEPRLGRNFEHVKIHTGSKAAQAAESIHAEAFTVGPSVIFNRGAYQPASAAGRRLLAHELVHVAQQGGARPADGRDQPPSFSSSPPKIQRYDSPTGRTDPNALIPVSDFITYVEAVERGYPSDTPQQILTRIRTQYYRGTAFEALIPDAPYFEVTGTRRVFNRQMGEMYETPITRDRRIEERAVGTPAYQHLTARADENARGDNPSPYIVMPNGDRIDAGHLLLGLDALLHPRTQAPFTVYGVPNIDPSSWVADLGIASVWMTVHEETGSPHSDVVNPPGSPNLTTYYNKSAPVEDLMGDVDSFGLHAQWQATPGQRLSQIIRGYYLGTGSASVRQRFQLFCAGNGLGYRRSGHSITWDAGVRGRLVTRIDGFSDLYAAGKWSAAWTTITAGTPSHRTWPHTPAIVDRFLAWVKTNLEAELGP